MNNNELQSHKKSDKVKWMLTGIAFILVAVILVGLCLQVFGKGKVKPSEWGKSSEEQQVEEGAFDITPTSGSAEMRLTSYSAVDDYPNIELAKNERIIKVDSGFYNGEIDVSVAFVGKPIFWFEGYGEMDDYSAFEYLTNAKGFISVIKIDSRIYKVVCLEPFGQRIEITFAFAEFPDISASCICDYTQSYEFTDVYIGFNSFMANGEVGRQPIVLNIMPISLELGEQGFYAGVNYYSTPYTIKAKDFPTNYKGLKFEFTVKSEWIEEYSLTDYNFASYSGSFDNGLIFLFEHFFDSTWFWNCVNGETDKIDDFARLLVVSGVDITPAYTLTISGLPEADGDCSYDVFFDIYNLVNYVEGLDA